MGVVAFALVVLSVLAVLMVRQRPRWNSKAVAGPRVVELLPLGPRLIRCDRNCRWYREADWVCVATGFTSARLVASATEAASVEASSIRGDRQVDSSRGRSSPGRRARTDAPGRHTSSDLP